MVNNPIAIADNIPDEKHEDGKYVEVCYFVLQRTVNCWQNDKSIDNRKDKGKHKQLF